MPTGTSIPKAGKLKCRVKSPRVCNNEGARKVTGRKKTDPVVNCCLGCFYDLKRQGLKLKYA